MTTDELLLKSVPFPLLKQLKGRVRKPLGQRVVSVPIRGVGGRALVAWKPDWKAHIIGRITAARDGVFVDVGANVGQTLLDLQSVAPSRRYIGFEPNPSCVSYLYDILSINHLEHCTVIPVGLSDHTAVVPMYLHAGAREDACATIMPSLRPGRSYDVEYIPCFRFDDIVETLQISTVSCIKIDVEGAELQVLNGMRLAARRFRPYILCEILFADALADFDAYASCVGKVQAWMYDEGYSVHHLIDKVGGRTRLQKVSNIPVGRWNDVLADLCDYVCVPVEDEAQFAPR